MPLEEEELFRILGISFVHSDDNKIHQSNLIEALKLYFSELRYPDPTVQYSEDKYTYEFNLNYQAASKLFDVIQSDDESIEFVISTIKETPVSSHTTGYLKVDFWTKMLIRYYPVDIAIKGFVRIYKSLFRVEYQNGILNLANRMIENFGDHNETFEVIKNLVNNFQSMKFVEKGVVRTGFISRYLNLKYKEGNRLDNYLINVSIFT